MAIDKAEDQASNTTTLLSDLSSDGVLGKLSIIFVYIVARVCHVTTPLSRHGTAGSILRQLSLLSFLVA